MESSARDYLANERTFLAYLRTAVAFIAFGFVIARFGLFVRQIAATTAASSYSAHVSVPFGVVMVCAGIAIAVFGLFRYIAVARALAHGGASELSMRSAISIVVLLAIAGVIVVYVMIRT
jgi:putative membrane protein